VYVLTYLVKYYDNCLVRASLLVKKACKSAKNMFLMCFAHVSVRVVFRVRTWVKKISLT